MAIKVAPFAGAWIEICSFEPRTFRNSVAPFAGAWIEIYISGSAIFRMCCRSLRGSVD